jgi:predicted acetyltransferase
MARVLVTCEAGNEPSRKTILANGGVLAGRAPSEHGGGAEKLLFWVGTSP